MAVGCCECNVGLSKRGTLGRVVVRAGGWAGVCGAALPSPVGSGDSPRGVPDVSAPVPAQPVAWRAGGPVPLRHPRAQPPCDGEVQPGSGGW